MKDKLKKASVFHAVFNFLLLSGILWYTVFENPYPALAYIIISTVLLAVMKEKMVSKLILIAIYTPKILHFFFFLTLIATNIVVLIQNTGIGILILIWNIANFLISYKRLKESWPTVKPDHFILDLDWINKYIDNPIKYFWIEEEIMNDEQALNKYGLAKSIKKLPTKKHRIKRG